MSKKSRHILRTMADLQQGDHICYIYDRGEDRRDFVESYLRWGLEHGEKTLYIADAPSLEVVLKSLRDKRHNAERHIKNGHMAILTVGETFLKNDSFDPDGMISLLQAEIDKALDAGYSGLRVASDMSWVFQRRPGSQHLIDFESRLDTFLSESECTMMCLYDRRKFSPILLLYALATHPVAAVGKEVYENLYYMPPPDFLGNKGIPVATLHYWLENLAMRKHGVAVGYA